ncbi:MAG: hypothetical protein U0Z44_12840 [Kouleothrix sp.]
MLVGLIWFVMQFIFSTHAGWCAMASVIDGLWRMVAAILFFLR